MKYLKKLRNSPISILVGVAILSAGCAAHYFPPPPTVTPFSQPIPPSFSATVIQPSFCHDGPDENYLATIIIPNDFEVNVLANSDDGNWLLIQAPSNDRCWIKASSVNSFGGNLDSLLTIKVVNTISNSPCHIYPILESDIQTVIPTGWRIAISGKNNLQADLLLVTPHDSTNQCWVESDTLQIPIIYLQDIPVISVLPTKISPPSPMQPTASQTPPTTPTLCWPPGRCR